MNILDKPTRPICGGIYNLTLDGYLICAQRRGTQLKGLLMRPALEYGKLVYRITINGRTTSIRAFIAVRDAWGQHMQDPGDYKEMCKAIDAHNAALRTENRANTIEKSRKKVERGICPYCGKLPIKTSGLSKTCGEPQCMAEHKRVTNREREQRQRISEIEKPIVGLATLGQYSMPCPWESHKLDTLPYGVTSWSDPIMDPLSGGFPMRTFSVPSTARRVAA